MKSLKKVLMKYILYFLSYWNTVHILTTTRKVQLYFLIFLTIPLKCGIFFFYFKNFNDCNMVLLCS